MYILIFEMLLTIMFHEFPILNPNFHLFIFYKVEAVDGDQNRQANAVYFKAKFMRKSCFFVFHAHIFSCVSVTYAQNTNKY